MNSSYICLACRRKGSQIRAGKAVQWLPRRDRATFISLTSSIQTTKDNPPKEDLLDLEKEMGKKKDRVPRAILEKRSRKSRYTNTNTAGDQLESMFEEMLKSPTSAAMDSSNPPVSLQIYKNAETLKDMIAAKNSSASEAWQFFLEHFGPDAWRDGSIDNASSPVYLYARRGEIGYRGEYIGRGLVDKIVAAMHSGSASTTLPTFTQVSRTYLQLGILHGTDWSKMMFSLIGAIVRHRQSSPADAAYDEKLILDLVGSWNVVFRRAEKGPSPTVTALDWSNAPILNLRDIVQAHQKRGPKAAFGFLAPIFPLHELVDIPLVGIATFALLTEDSLTGKTSLEDAKPLISSLAQIISIPSLEVGKLVGHPYIDSAPILDFVKENWPQIKTRASRALDRPDMNSTAKQQFFSQAKDNNYIHRRLKDAMNRSDSIEVDKLWTEVMRYPIFKDSAPVTDGERSKGPPKGTLSAGTCNYFIMVYIALRQPNSAIDIWNHMVNAGLSPDLRTWNHMLLGCKAARDPGALEGIWAKMQALRVQPDVVCWTSRVSGLIECHKVDESLRALDEMGRLWLAAARKQHGNKAIEALQEVGDIEGAVKPTIETINAAVSGLIRKHKLDAAQHVLAWASKFGIYPDNITYNTLLRPLVRNGQLEQAMLLLQQMQHDGIQADVATFTTILEETFRYSEQHTVEEQQEIITNVFSEMEAAGIKANLHTYGRIIYQLLLNDNSDLTAVNAVMSRMSQQGLNPSPHIYTMLVKYYFSRQPPDLDAVRVLIERSQSEVGSVDHVFWDRVIEGYALVGDTASAMRILGKVTGPSMRVGWVTLQQVLTALAKNEEWDLAKTLVRNAKLDSGGPLADDVKGKEGQHGFWRLARQLELLDA